MEKPSSHKVSEETYRAFTKAMENVTGVPARMFSRNYLKREIETPSTFTGCQDCGVTRATLFTTSKNGRHLLDDSGNKMTFCAKHRPEE